jgi:Fe-S-cluster containining protein
MPIFALSIHADYRCRHAGACCSTAWDVPVEVAVHRTIADALAAGRVQVPPLRSGQAVEPFLTEPPPPAGAAAILRRGESGACVFYEHDSHLCGVHRALGESALPATCRIFPRIALTDARGTFITLSHYCPTAAAMLFRTDVPLEIVESPSAFPPADYEGMSAVGEWPPLLTPGILMNLESYSAWERHAVGVCARAATPESAVATLSRDADRLSQWRPGTTSLLDAVAGLDVELVLTSGTTWGGFNPVVNRFLAAHAFANWSAYQGRDLRTCVRSVEHALGVLKDACTERPLDREGLLEGIRRADYLLRHEGTKAI